MTDQPVQMRRLISHSLALISQTSKLSLGERRMHIQSCRKYCVSVALSEFQSVPGFSLTLCCFVVYSTRRFVLCLNLCYFVLVCFSPFSIAITSLWEERANFSAFRTFFRYVLVWFYRFPLPLGVWKGLRFVIVVLPRLFSYLFVFISRLHLHKVPGYAPDSATRHKCSEYVL